MTVITDSVLDEIVNVIVEAVEPEKIVLFGSRASGKSGSDSDLDLLVIVPEPFGGGRSRIKEMAKLWRKLARFNLPKDILVYSRDEVEYWRDSVNNAVARALREGKVLYERH